MAETALGGWLRLAMGCLTMAVLASCAAPAAAPVPPVQTGATGSIKLGTIVAIRAIDPADGQNGIQPGLNDVMAGLQEPAPKLSFKAKEFVVQLRNGNPVSMVTRDPGATTAGTMPADDFSVGDQVEIVEGAETELVHAN